MECLPAPSASSSSFLLQFLDQEEGLGGELLLSIKAEPIERTPFWTLDVKVKEARQLATWSTGGHCDAFVKW